MSSEPSMWMDTAPIAKANRLCCSNVTTSAENVENVVNPPRNPVMTISRHSVATAACVLKKFKAMPIKKPPNRFAARVPRGMVEDMALSCRPSNQGNKAPAEAPAQIARIEYISAIPT